MRSIPTSLQFRLVLTLGNDVSFRPWLCHSRQFSCDSLVTIRGWDTSPIASGVGGMSLIHI